MSLRKIQLVVGNTASGSAVTFAYPAGANTNQLFNIPTYALSVSGTTNNGRALIKKFDVLRFGVQQKTPKDAPRVVGLADQQTHVIKAWLPNYSVHSAHSVENGAWQVYGNFLIHDGPDDPSSEVYASIGCIEICGGPMGFVQFNNHIISLSGSIARTRGRQLAEIGRSKILKITYMAAKRPPLTSYNIP